MRRKDKPELQHLDLPKTQSSFNTLQPLWFCNSNGFFGMIIEPLSEMGSGFTALHVPGENAPTRLSLIDAHYALYPAHKYPAYLYRIPLRASSSPLQLRIFSGPLEDDILKQIDHSYSQTSGINPYYSLALSFQGWFTFISEPFGKFLFFLMKAFYWLTHSWGLSIILLTIALRVMLYPLNNWSIQSTLKMQAISPKVAAIQAKYKKDPKKAQMEIIALYREAKVNPISGCFPLLIQLPFLIGMFDLLKSVFELRGAPFIPGWIDNLTAPDTILSWNYPLLFLGTQLHLLPILIGIAMYFQQRLSSSLPRDKADLTDQQKQQLMIGNIMTIVFTVLFYHFPSGLNLYWLFSISLGILQQAWTSQRKKNLPKPSSLKIMIFFTF
jgi:YidC/Oxa1 family membrane protein insertase